MPIDGGVDVFAVAGQLFRELDRPGRRLDQLPQHAPPFKKRPVAEIPAVECRRSKATNASASRCSHDRRAKLAKGDAADLVEYDHLAIDVGRAAGQSFRGLGDRPIFVRPVMAAAGERPRFARLEHNLRPIAVELQLMQPVLAFRRLADQGRLHRLDEVEPVPHNATLCHYPTKPNRSSHRGSGIFRHKAH